MSSHDDAATIARLQNRLTKTMAERDQARKQAENLQAKCAKQRNEMERSTQALKRLTAEKAALHRDFTKFRRTARIK